jgi:hypothetical protein
VANGLAYLQVDLTDPDFHAITLAQFRAMRDETRQLLDEAVAARELVPCDTEEIARLVQQVHDGAMLAWAVYREGALEQWMRREVIALLAPYKRKSPIRKRHGRAQKKGWT